MLNDYAPHNTSFSIHIKYIAHNLKWSTLLPFIILEDDENGYRQVVCSSKKTFSIFTLHERMNSFGLSLETWISIAILNWNIFNDSLFGFIPQTKLHGLAVSGWFFLFLFASVERWWMVNGIFLLQLFEIS